MREASPATLPMSPAATPATINKIASTPGTTRVLQPLVRAGAGTIETSHDADDLAVPEQVVRPGGVRVDPPAAADPLRRCDPGSGRRAGHDHVGRVAPSGDRAGQDQPGAGIGTSALPRTGAGGLAPPHREGPRSACVAAGPSLAGAVHDRRVLSHTRGNGVSRSPSTCRIAGLCYSGRRGLRTPTGRSRTDLVLAGRGRRRRRHRRDGRRARDSAPPGPRARGVLTRGGSNWCPVAASAAASE